MPNHSEIYRLEPEQYDLLISKQPNLLERIQCIHNLEGQDVIDLGAGTGRLTVPIAQQAKSVLALDASEAMLRVTAKKLKNANLNNWNIRVSDHRKIQAEDNSADVLVSGWSICYIGSSNVHGWKENVAATINEIKRVLRPGGTVIKFETLGTGVEFPSPPDFLTGYYSMLEKVYNFQNTWIRTDYQFDNLDEAERLTKFFFGTDISEKVVREKRTTLPECAGIWWRSF
ncbi:class I SAM-dependent methyltransferase [Microaerobacter geothermalis]|uniref:class I SAM-dependent methyltransferase n=1 Tax=Microaerobacter geothermalis TaxID=674972 RepID=UPI001F2C7DC4|nr:class I SAM-dependent methyltransferase [Microaerobacter geothermalis]MCF6093795.1 class I SAM-dependent methyltransferase [Microaerobacter geothermalis]